MGRPGATRPPPMDVEYMPDVEPERGVHPYNIMEYHDPSATHHIMLQPCSGRVSYWRTC